MNGGEHDQAEQAGGPAGAARAAVRGGQARSVEDPIIELRRIGGVDYVVECPCSAKHPQGADPLEDVMYLGSHASVLRRELEIAGHVENLVYVTRWKLLVTASLTLSDDEDLLGNRLKGVLEHCERDQDFKAGLLATILSWAPGAWAYVGAHGHSMVRAP